MKKAFTLAEVMITLTVIGIITAVIIPVAIHSKPDEDTLKFKKAHNVLYETISILVNSDKYYQDGDLGIKKEGVEVAGNNIGGSDGKTGLYFCQTFSDVISVKSECISRTEKIYPYEYGFAIGLDEPLGLGQQLTTLPASQQLHQYDTVVSNVTKTEIQETKAKLDEACKEHTEEGEEIKTTDNIVYYEIGTAWAKFGSGCPGLAAHLGGSPNHYRCFGKKVPKNAIAIKINMEMTMPIRPFV